MISLNVLFGVKLNFFVVCGILLNLIYVYGVMDIIIIIDINYFLLGLVNGCKFLSVKLLLKNELKNINNMMIIIVI